MVDTLPLSRHRNQTQTIAQNVKIRNSDIGKVDPAFLEPNFSPANELGHTPPELLRKANYLLKTVSELGLSLVALQDAQLLIQQSIMTLNITLECSLSAYISQDFNAPQRDDLFAYGPDSAKLKEIKSLLSEVFQSTPAIFAGTTPGIHSKTLSTSGVEIFHGNETYPSLIKISLTTEISEKQAAGGITQMVVLADSRPGFFDELDLRFAADICAQLSAGLSRVRYNESVQNISRAAVKLVDIRQPQELLTHLAMIASDATGAELGLAAIFEDGEWIVGRAGESQRISWTDPAGVNQLLHTLARRPGILKWRKSEYHELIQALDFNDGVSRPALACSFKLSDYVSAQEAVILVYGRNEYGDFSSGDENLIQQVANQAALALNHVLMCNELRADIERSLCALNISLDISRSHSLLQAARTVLGDIRRQFAAESAGLVLFGEGQDAILQIGLPQVNEEDLAGTGILPTTHPMSEIAEVMATGRQVNQPLGDSLKKVFPVQTSGYCYGALWLELPLRISTKDDEIRSLVNQAAVALEGALRREKLQNDLNRLLSISPKTDF